MRSTLSTPSGSTQKEAVEEERMQDRLRLVLASSPDVYAGHLHWRHRKQYVLLQRVTVRGLECCTLLFSQSVFPCQIMRTTAEDKGKKDAGIIGLSRQDMYGTRDAANDWECHWQNNPEELKCTLGQSSHNLFRHTGTLSCSIMNSTARWQGKARQS